MVEVRQSRVFRAWLDELGDPQARARIVVRIRRMEIGNFGDVRPVGGGVSEMRIPYGPGYRVYFVQAGSSIVVLLCGGDKRSQKADILRARTLAEER